jgi:hypothetical protein
VPLGSLVSMSKNCYVNFLLLRKISDYVNKNYRMFKAWSISWLEALCSVQHEVCDIHACRNCWPSLHFHSYYSVCRCARARACVFDWHYQFCWLHLLISSLVVFFIFVVAIVIIFSVINFFYWNACRQWTSLLVCCCFLCQKKMPFGMFMKLAFYFPLSVTFTA